MYPCSIVFNLAAVLPRWTVSCKSLALTLIFSITSGIFLAISLATTVLILPVSSPPICIGA